MDEEVDEAVTVRRTGGLLGEPVVGRIVLRPAPAAPDESAPDESTLVEVDALLARVRRPLAARLPPRGADRFTYEFELPGRKPFVVPEQAMTADLHRLADLVLAHRTI